MKLETTQFTDMTAMIQSLPFGSFLPSGERKRRKFSPWENFEVSKHFGGRFHLKLGSSSESIRNLIGSCAQRFWPWSIPFLFQNPLLSLEACSLHSLCACALLIPSCPILCGAIDCSLLASSVHGILQARILEWVAMPSSSRSPWSKDWIHISRGSFISGGFFTVEPLGKTTFSLA